MCFQCLHEALGKLSTLISRIRRACIPCSTWDPEEATLSGSNLGALCAHRAIFWHDVWLPLVNPRGWGNQPSQVFSPKINQPGKTPFYPEWANTICGITHQVEYPTSKANQINQTGKPSFFYCLPKTHLSWAYDWGILWIDLFSFSFGFYGFLLQNQGRLSFIFSYWKHVVVYVYNGSSYPAKWRIMPSRAPAPDLIETALVLQDALVQLDQHTCSHKVN